MFKPAIAFILLCLATGTVRAQAQDFEYGSAAELRGVTSIYVHTGINLEVRENIIKTIQKKLAHITIANSVREAQVVLGFSADSYTYLATVYHSSSSQTTGSIAVPNQPYGPTINGTYSSKTNSNGYSAPVYRRVITGSGLVTMRGPGGRARLIMEYQGSKSNIFQKQPSTKFANAFIEAYEKANKGFVGMPAAAALTAEPEPEPQPVSLPVELPIAPKQPAPIATPETSSITITSTPDGADISIDGKFVGSTPSTVRLAPGDHNVSIDKRGFKLWTRVMTVTANGSVTVAASLERTPSLRIE